MALMKETVEHTPSQESIRPTPNEYRGIAIDSKQTPLKTIITHIKGSRQIVTWYSQLLGRDNETSGHRVNGTAVYQGYKKIIDLEMKVTNALPDNPDHDSNSREMSMSGEATLYPGLIPNAGDEFIMRVRGGRFAVFVVQQDIKELSIFNNKAHSFTYEFRNYLTSDYEKELERKVVQTYYFIRDNLDTGLNPIITEESYQDYQILLEWEEKLPIEYMTRFYSREVNCPLIPDQTFDIYDPFHTRFTMAVFGDVPFGTFRSVMSLNVTGNIEFPIKTIHDAILEFMPTNLDDIVVINNIESKENFMANPTLLGTRFLPVNFVIYPKHYAPKIYRYFITGGGGSCGGCGGDSRKPAVNLEPGKRRPTKIRRSIGGLFNDVPSDEAGFELDGLDDYKPVTIDNYYIFSEDFYGLDREKCSLVERLVLDMLEDKMVNSKELIRLLNASAMWPSLERYYYQPFLFSMINYALRSVE